MWGLDVVRKISLESEYCRRFRDLLEVFVASGDMNGYLSCLKIEVLDALREYQERVEVVNQHLRDGWKDDSENDPVVVVDAPSE